MKQGVIGASLLLAVSVSAQDIITVDPIFFPAGVADGALTVRLAANTSGVTALQMDVELADGVTVGTCTAQLGRQTQDGITGWNFGQPTIGKPDAYTGLNVMGPRLRAIYLPEGVFEITPVGYLATDPMPVGPLFSCLLSRDMVVVPDGHIEALQCFGLGSTFDARPVPMRCEGPMLVAGCQIAPGPKTSPAWAVVLGGACAVIMRIAGWRGW